MVFTDGVGPVEALLAAKAKRIARRKVGKIALWAVFLLYRYSINCRNSIGFGVEKTDRFNFCIRNARD